MKILGIDRLELLESYANGVDGVDALHNGDASDPEFIEQMVTDLRAIDRLKGLRREISYREITLFADIRRLKNRSGQIVPLTNTENQVMRLLIVHQQYVVTYKRFRRLPGWETVKDPDYKTREYIHRLRVKVGDPDYDDKYIHTIPASGYILATNNHSLSNPF